MPEETAEDVALVATELVSNAVRHASPANPEAADCCRLLLELPAPDTVRVTVYDASTRRPVLRQAADDDATGRGLFLVAAFASDWGVRPVTDGKAVWAVLTGGQR